MVRFPFWTYLPRPSGHRTRSAGHCSSPRWPRPLLYRCWWCVVRETRTLPASPRVASSATNWLPPQLPRHSLARCRYLLGSCRGWTSAARPSLATAQLRRPRQHEDVAVETLTVFFRNCLSTLPLQALSLCFPSGLLETVFLLCHSRRSLSASPQDFLKL